MSRTSAFALKPPAEGVPTTILYDSKGIERARLAGDALMPQK